MAEDKTIRPEAADAGQQMSSYDELTMQTADNIQANYQQLQQQAQGTVCPACGTINDADAMFCASCGQPLRTATCPNCGSEIDPEADFCEICHHYIRTDVCSFCGTKMEQSEIYCHECGNPRGGIVCPVCNTLNDFAFCKQCGAPLTDEAKALVAEVKQHPDYQLLAREAKELEELNMQLPISSERDKVHEQMNEKLRERVLMLLAKDRGVLTPVVPRNQANRLTKEELTQLKENKMKTITRILDRMAVPQMPSPVKARNYAMAQKPGSIRLAWVCNWKKAMHSSPCGCAKPQLGGKWVILGKTNKGDIKDDK